MRILLINSNLKDDVLAAPPIGLCYAASAAFAQEVTPEMLSQTQPNRIDLLVAIVTGFVMAYTIIDERISSSELPGVALGQAVAPAGQRH